MAQRRGLTRRAVLRALGAAGAATAAGTLTPRATHAQALGRHEPVETALERLFGDRALQDGRARIRLDIPNIAENGASVPVSVEVDAPMTPQRYVPTSARRSARSTPPRASARTPSSRSPSGPPPPAR